ncbi:MAG: T9SS type A sorting domain-containing protein [Bacteroidia bacterium]|nr:T9SS type A sorting domain-containing protein [Bacteroidia bacterium]
MRKVILPACLLIGAVLFLSTPLRAQFFLQWDFFDLATDIRQSGANPDVEIDAAGTIHISYWQRVEDKLMYARKPVSGPWTFEKIDPSGLNGFKSSLAIGPGDTIYIAYYENINGDFQVRLAKRLGPSNWQTEQIPDNAAQFGNGWGEYGNWGDAARTESIKNCLDLGFDANGKPKIVFFASWYDLDIIAPCGSYYNKYEFQPYIAWKSGSTWNVNQINDYPNKTFKCSGSPLPWGDRYGEFITLLKDPQGNESIVTNSYYNREIVQMKNSGDNLTWTPSVVDSQPTIYTVFNAGADINLFTMESVSAAYDDVGNLHAAYTTSFLYGLSFHPNLPWWYTLVYVRIDTAGNVFQFNKEPFSNTLNPHRTNTHILPVGTDTVYLSYYEGTSEAFLFESSYDGGQTWALDTMLKVLASEKAKFVKHGDTLYSAVYDEGGDRLMVGKRALSDSAWSFVPITISQERGIFFDAKTYPEAVDTTTYMVYDGFYEKKLFVNRGSISSGIWVGSEEEIAVGEGKFNHAAITKGNSNETVVVYSAGKDKRLRLAIDNGSGWSYETIDTSTHAGFVEVGVSANNAIHVAWYDEDSLWLKYATRPISGGNWTFEIVDTVGPPVGEYPDLVTDASNRVHMVYHKGSDRSVNYALRNSPGNWTTEEIHSDSNLILGRDASIELMQGGNVGIAYCDEVKFRILFAERTGPGTWVRTTLDSSGTSISPRPIELEVDKYGNPWVAYNYNDGFDRVKLQKRDSTVWSTIAVSTTGRIANEFSLNIVDTDLYLPGKKNKQGASGIGLLHSRNGIFVGRNPELELPQPALTVYPNPARDQIYFTLQNPVSREMSLDLIDLMGRKKLDIFGSHRVSAGETRVQASLQNLPAGVYIYRLQSRGNLLSMGRVVILK